MADQPSIGPLALYWRAGGFWLILGLGLSGFMLGIWLNNAGWANQLEKDGITTNGKILNVEKRREYKTDKPNEIHYRYSIDYQFETADGEFVKSSYVQAETMQLPTSNYKQGNEIQVRYSESDPSIHEIGEGMRGKESRTGYYGLLISLAATACWAVWTAIQVAAILSAKNGGETIEARVIQGVANERPPRVHLELPDGQRIKNRFTPLRGPRPQVGSLARVFVRGKTAIWEGDLR